MSLLTVYGQVFDIRVSRRDGRSVAHAVRAGTHDRFGPDFTGATDDEAVACLNRWLEWQHGHSEALEALRAAERAYHRAVTSHVLAGETDRSAAGQERSECLERVSSARARLDEVRASRPE